MRNVLPAAITMIGYGLTVLFIGGLTYFVAPPGSSAVTALIVSIAAAVAMSACAVMSLMIGSKRVVGMIGIHLGLVLPLLVAVGPLMRLRGSLDKAHAFNEAVKAPGGIILSTETLSDKTRPHPVGYQSVGLGAIGAVSVLAFVTLLVQRPRVGKEAKVASGGTPALGSATGSRPGTGSLSGMSGGVEAGVSPERAL